MHITHQSLARKIASTFTDSIVEYDGIVDFEATLGSLADRIMEEVSENYMINIFGGTAFTNTEYCEDYLRNNLPDLYDECQRVVDIKYSK